MVNKITVDRYTWIHLIVSMIAFVVSLLLSYWLVTFSDYAVLILLLTVSIAVTWYAGIAYGLFVIIVSIVAIDYFFLLPVTTLSLILVNILLLGLFGLGTMTASWLKQRMTITQQSLREKDMGLQLALETARMVSWTWEAVEDRITVSDNFSTIYGAPHVDVSAQGFALLHPEDRATHQAIVQQAAVAGSGYHSIFRIIRPDNGKVVWLEERSQMIFGSNRKPIKMIGIVQDITEQKQTEVRLTVLQQLTSALSQAATPDQVAQVIVNQGFSLLGAQVGSVALLTEDQEALEFPHWTGYSSDLIQEFRRVALSDPLPLSDAVRTQQPVWLPDLETYQQKYPQLVANVQSRTGSQAIVSIPLTVKDRKLGGLGLGFSQPQSFTDDEKTFILALAQQCALALDRAQQAQQLAAEHERQRLARDLHDSVSQSLFSTSMMAESLPTLWERDPIQAKERTSQVVQLTQGAMAEMRALLMELRPETIIRAKLHELLHQLGKAAQGRKSIELVLTVEEVSLPLPPTVQVAIYRIAQESINNVVKHSQATQLRIRLQSQPEQIILQIEDNGRGFDLQQQSSGFGQTTLRERAKAIDAVLTVDSELGKGTQITLVWKPSTP